MRRISRLRKAHAVVIAVVALAMLGVGAGVVAAQSPGGGDAATGSATDGPAQAALEATGGGTVNDVERENASTWEVEVTLADGSQVEVVLDDALNVISTSPGDGPGVADGPEDNNGPDNDSINDNDGPGVADGPEDNNGPDNDSINDNEGPGHVDGPGDVDGPDDNEGPGGVEDGNDSV